ncbi:hypothetical protein [Marinobacter litoralis]|nr:hypothetical protein [Marinobacter litoralis]
MDIENPSQQRQHDQRREHAKPLPVKPSNRDDRLYLNYSQSIQDRWLENPDGFIQQANANWPEVLE